MATNDLPNMKYDFSVLSRGRLRAYNKMVEEFERLESEGIDLSDEALGMLSAAGTPEQDYDDRMGKHKVEH